jgi:hypothetical protein
MIFAVGQQLSGMRRWEIPRRIKRKRWGRWMDATVVARRQNTPSEHGVGVDGLDTPMVAFAPVMTRVAGDEEFVWEPDEGGRVGFMGGAV